MSVNSLESGFLHLAEPDIKVRDSLQPHAGATCFGHAETHALLCQGPFSQASQKSCQPGTYRNTRTLIKLTYTQAALTSSLHPSQISRWTLRCHYASWIMIGDVVTSARARYQGETWICDHTTLCSSEPEWLRSSRIHTLGRTTKAWRASVTPRRDAVNPRTPPETASKRQHVHGVTTITPRWDAAQSQCKAQYVCSKNNCRGSHSPGASCD